MTLEMPTEPIGSIPRPPELIDAVAQHGAGRSGAETHSTRKRSATPSRRFEATGSPVITDGEQRKYHNFWTYCVQGLTNTAPDGFRIPFSAGHVRRMPRLTCAARSATSGTRTSYLDVALRYAKRPVKQAVISPSALSLMYPAEEHPRLPARPVHRRPARASTRRRSAAACSKGAHSVQIDFTEGRLAVKIDPTGRAAAQLHRPEQPRAVALLRGGARALRRAHLPGRRPRLDPQRGRRLRRAAAEPVRAEGRQLLRRPGGRKGPRRAC